MVWAHVQNITWLIGSVTIHYKFEVSRWYLSSLRCFCEEPREWDLVNVVLLAAHVAVTVSGWHGVNCGCVPGTSGWPWSVHGSNVKQHQSPQQGQGTRASPLKYCYMAQMVDQSGCNLTMIGIVGHIFVLFGIKFPVNCFTSQICQLRL